MQVNDKMVEAARDWLRKRWCQEHPNEGHVKMLAEYAAALAHREAEAALPEGTLSLNYYDVTIAFSNRKDAEAAFDILETAIGARSALVEGGEIIPSGYGEFTPITVGCSTATPAPADERVTISTGDAKTLIGVIEEFYVHNELSREEARAFLSLCQSGNFGRPVVTGRRPEQPADERVVEALRQIADLEGQAGAGGKAVNIAKAALAATEGRKNG